MTRRPTVCIVTVMKNEGPFILEWIAHNRLIGIDRVLVYTNDCTDGTDAILDRLAELGMVEHHQNPSVAAGDERHIFHAVKDAKRREIFASADYSFVTDVDEFLQLNRHETLPELLEDYDRPDVVSFSELLFGFGGVVRFEDRPVTEQFLVSSDLRPGRHRARRGVKSVTRITDAVAMHKNHRPKIRHDRIAEVRWLDAASRPVSEDFIREGDRGFDARGTYDSAVLRHYSLRSAETALTKFERGDAVRQDRLDDAYCRKRNAAREVNTPTAAEAQRLRDEIAELKADATLARRHRDAVAAHRATIDRLKADPAYADRWAQIVALASADLPFAETLATRRTALLNEIG